MRALVLALLVFAAVATVVAPAAAAETCRISSDGTIVCSCSGDDEVVCKVARLLDDVQRPF